MVRIAVLLVLVLSLAVVACGGGNDSDSTPLVTTDQSLQISQSGLRICVDHVDAEADVGADVERVEEAIRELRGELEDRSYSGAVLARLDEAVVTAGCPRPAAADERHRFIDPKTDVLSVIGPRAELPIEHNLRVYFVREETLDDWFGDVVFASGVEEMLCSGHQCAAGTGGLYVRASAGDRLLYDQLRRVLGFDPDTAR